MKKPKPQFHPHAPRRLVKLWKDYPAHYRIAKYLNVNIAEVWKALVKGKEPVNQDVRVKFGLPRKPRKPRAVSVPKIVPNHIRWWRRLDPTLRRDLIKQIYDKF